MAIIYKRFCFSFFTFERGGTQEQPGGITVADFDLRLPPRENNEFCVEGGTPCPKDFPILKFKL